LAAEIRFLAIDGEHRKILEWFSEQTLRARENATPDRVLFWYESEGPLAYWPTEISISDNASHRQQKKALMLRWQQEHAPGQQILDSGNTPLVSIELPRKVRGVLWTTGEVTFTGTPLRNRFPRLASLHRSLVRWLRQFELVFDPRMRRSDFDYFLEGTIRNYDSEVRALPHALAALRNGQYFINTGAEEAQVEKLCRQLRLRGVNCDPA